MNVVIPLTDLEAERLTVRATRAGLDLVEYLRRGAVAEAKPSRHAGRIDTIAVKVKALHAEGMHDTEIAREINVSASTVSSKRYVLKLPSHPHPRFGRATTPKESDR